MDMFRQLLRLLLFKAKVNGGRYRNNTRLREKEKALTLYGDWLGVIYAEVLFPDRFSGYSRITRTFVRQECKLKSEKAYLSS